ncbi:hypothetical protein JTB14_021572 [Gonioctena quinquepunctata]|nr:hypothetical protein JTB14_021572 [Gonioctena quinquepunctata]
MVIDEEFHLPLGIAYCNFNLNLWDPKVTTLPGLYLVSAFILGPFDLCTTYWLRFVSLGASIVNIILIHTLYSKYDKNEWRTILSSFSIALLPPLYFFGNIYYTEVVSLTMVLLMLVSYEKGYHFFASIFGYGAVVCRQTNVIWVGFVFGRYVLLELYAVYLKMPPGKGLPMRDLKRFVEIIVREVDMLLWITSLQFWLDVFSYASVLLSFMISSEKYSNIGFQLGL